MPADCATRRADNQDRESWFPSHVSGEHYDVRQRDATRIIREMWEWPSVSSVAEGEKSLEEQFHEQADKWQQETQHLSSPSQRMLHPSYQAIMGMARDKPDEVVNLMLRDMQQNRREWFWALSYLTHENPIERKNAGSLDKMIEAWVRWGQQRRGRR
jgi:hypothetical protein